MVKPQLDPKPGYRLQEALIECQNRPGEVAAMVPRTKTAFKFHSGDWWSWGSGWSGKAEWFRLGVPIYGIPMGQSHGIHPSLIMGLDLQEVLWEVVPVSDIEKSLK